MKKKEIVRFPGMFQWWSYTDTKVLFNLEGVDAWRGASRAATGRGGPTDWELLQIQQNPQWWHRIEWWKGGEQVSNPFVGGGG